MPQTLIIIFLLLFAALAFGWFYWQRAKGRAVATETPATTEAPATTETPTAATAAEQTETTDTTPAS